MRSLGRLLAVFAAACVAAMPAWGVRQFPAPSFTRAVPEAAGEAIAASASANRIFVADAALDRVAVVGEGGAVTYVPVGRTPRHIIAVGFGFITSNAGDGSLSLSRDAASATTVSVGGSGPMVADTGGHVYLLRPDGIVVIVDVATFAVRTFDTGLRAPVQHLVSKSGGQLFVADAGGEIRIFEVYSTPRQTDTKRVTGRPGAMLYLEPAGKLYVLVEGSTAELVEFHFSERTVKSIALAGNPRGARALAVWDDIFYAGFSNVLVTVDFGLAYMDFFEGEVLSIDIDPAGRAFVLYADRNLDVFEPRTFRRDTVPLPAASQQVLYVGAACTAYVAGAALTLVRAPCSSEVASSIDVQGLWWIWTGKESGWGLNITQQGETLFATWFTYDARGRPTWFVMSNGAKSGINQYSGQLYRTTGPPFNAPVFDPSRVTRTASGTAGVFVNEAAYLIFGTTVDGFKAQYPLGRQVFSWPLPMCDTDVTPGARAWYQDLWWNPAESGWGLNVAHQGDILFVTWFTYDTDGSATWFVASNVARTGEGTYTGTLYRTSGPPMTAIPWDASKVTRTAVGEVTLTFRDGDNGTFAYTVNGFSGSKAITRQVYATPVTRCR